MTTLNKVMIMGNLGKDPEIRFTKTQVPVGSFSVATQEFTTQNGQRAETTEWHRVIVWDKLASNCQKYLKKGSGVFVEGRLRTNTWTTKDGEKRYTTEIIAQNVQFLPSGKRDEAQPMPEPPPFDDLMDIPF